MRVLGVFCQSIFFGKLKLDDVQISLPPLAWGQLLRISGYGVIIEEVLFLFFLRRLLRSG